MRDSIEARAKSQVALEDEVRISSAMAEVGRDIIAKLDSPSLLQKMCELIVTTCNCDSSHTLMWDPNQQQYMPIAGFGTPSKRWDAAKLHPIPEASLEMIAQYAKDQDIVELVFNETGTRNDRDFTQLTFSDISPDLRERAHFLGIERALCICLRQGESLVGFQTVCYRDRDREFSDTQVRIASGLAHIACLALDHVQLLEAFAHASRLQLEFTATISHELRTPLNIILGYSGMLLSGASGELTEGQKEVVLRMERSTQDLTELITATLDISKFESGSVSLDIEEFAVEELAEDIESELYGLIEGQPSIEVHWDFDPELRVRSDRSKIKTVIRNVLSNALKFSDQGIIIVTLRHNTDGLSIRVHDSGGGIPADQIPPIFEAFRHAESPTTRRP